MEIRDAPKLVKVTRLDSVPMPRAYFTPEGYLKDKPVLTSTGIFEYANPDGSIRRELRLPEDVFDPKSLKSYLGKPIVVTHDAGLIDKDNVAENQIGTILSEGERRGNDVVASIIIHDTEAMKDAGFKELSLGYNLDLDETPGEWNGQHYDARQRNIVINHLALVREARAGEQARLNMDGRDQENVLKGGKRMSKKITKTRHGDSVLSQEEFEKAIDEYKMRKAQREKTDADDVVEEKAVEEIKERNPKDIEAQLAEVKARRDRRDEDGDPEDMEGAMSVIAHQDEDIDILYDIIDTLLAKQDFDAAEPEVEEVAEEEEVIDDEENQDELDKMNKLKGDADDEGEFIEEEKEKEEEVKEDADEDIEDVEEDVDEEEEVKEDADDEEVEEEVVEEDKDWEEDGDDCGSKKERMDSAISRSVRNHMIMGNIGRQVGLKNLEMKDIRDAKIAIIKKVRPDMRLDGKSDAYINGAFESARKTIKEKKAKGVAYQKRQMFNKDSRDTVRENGSSAMDARQRMIERQKNK